LEAILSQQISCQQAGFLPIPLSQVPIEALKDIKIYLFKENEYVLFTSSQRSITLKDITRFIESGIDIAYCSVNDHQKYYDAIKHCINNVIQSPTIRKDVRCNLLYHTCISFVDDLYSAPLTEASLENIGDISKAIVTNLLESQDTFSILFDLSNHDFYSATHTVNVCNLLVALGNKLKLDKDIVIELGIGALVHDIGKIFIDADVLNEKGILTDEQFSELRSHVTRGVDHLVDIGSFSDVAMHVISEHHEKLDGSGYPNKLKGDQISLYGRMSAIVDMFEAMTSVRPYRSHEYTIEEVFDILEKEAATDKLDKEILAAFKSLINETLSAEEEDNISHQTLLGELTTETSTDINTRALRYHFRLSANLRFVAKKQNKIQLENSQRIIIHNMSQSGIAFYTTNDVKPGKVFRISIDLIPNIKPIVLYGIVVWSQLQPDKWTSVGAKFSKPLNKRTIKQIQTVTPIHTIN